MPVPVDHHQLNAAVICAYFLEMGATDEVIHIFATIPATVDAAGSATDGTAFSSGGFLAGSGGLGTSGFGGCASRVALCECCASSSFASSSPMVASRSLSWLCSLASARLRVVASSGCRASTACQRERSGHGAGRGAGRTAPGLDAGYRCELLLLIRM